MNLPDPILKLLDGVATRRRRLILIAGLTWLVGVGLVFLLAACAIDRFWIVSQPWRIAIWAGGVSALTVAAIVKLLIPLTRRQSPVSAAAAVEKRHNNLDEAMRSVVELHKCRDPDALRGSPELIDCLNQRTARAVRDIQPKDVISYRPIRRMLLPVVLLLFGAAVCWAIWPGKSCHLTARAVNPWGNYDRVSDRTITVSPGDAAVARGSEVALEARISGPPADKVILEKILLPGGGRETRDMPPSGRNVFRIRLTCQREITYRVRAGDQITRWYRLRGIDPPRAERLDVSYRYPAYTGLAARSFPDSPGDLAGPPGTRGTIEIQTNKPLKDGWLELDGADKTRIPLVQTDRLLYRVETTLTANGRFRYRLRGAEGFENASAPAYSIRILPDRPPEAVILHPTESLRLSPKDTFALHLTARDDFALSGAEMLIQLDDQRVQSLPIELPKDRPLNQWQGTTRIDLSRIKIGASRSLTFQFRVTDNRPKPQEGLSARGTVIFDTGADAFAIQQVLSLREEIRKRLQNTDTALKAIRPTMKPLAKQANKDPFPDQAIKALKKVREGLGTAEKNLSSLARETELTEYEFISRQADRILAESLSSARLAADDLALEAKASTVKRREALAKKINQAATKTHAEIKALADRFERIVRAEDQAVQFDRLASAQRRLIEQMPKPGSRATATPAQSTIESLSRQQEQILRQMAEMIRDRPELGQAVLAENQKQLPSLRAQYQQILRQQQKLNKTTGVLNESAQLTKASANRFRQQQSLTSSAIKLSRRYKKFFADSKVPTMTKSVPREKILSILRRQHQALAAKAKALTPRADPNPQRREQKKWLTLAGRITPLIVKQKEEIKIARTAAGTKTQLAAARKKTAQRTAAAGRAAKEVAQLKKKNDPQSQKQLAALQAKQTESAKAAAAARQVEDHLAQKLKALDTEAGTLRQAVAGDLAKAKGAIPPAEFSQIKSPQMRLKRLQKIHAHFKAKETAAAKIAKELAKTRTEQIAAQKPFLAGAQQAKALAQSRKKLSAAADSSAKRQGTLAKALQKETRRGIGLRFAAVADGLADMRELGDNSAELKDLMQRAQIAAKAAQKGNFALIGKTAKGAPYKDKLADLHRKFTRLTEESKRLSEGKPAGFAGLRQSNLTAESHRFAQSLARFETLTPYIFPEGRKVLAAARKIVTRQVIPATRAAAKALHASNPAGALPHQKKALAGLTKAGKQLNRLDSLAAARAAALAKQNPPDNQKKTVEEMAEQLLAAMEAQWEAQQEANPASGHPDPAAALEAMIRANQAMDAADKNFWKLAQGMGLSLWDPSQVGQEASSGAAGTGLGFVRSSVGRPIREAPLRWRLLGTTSAEWTGPGAPLLPNDSPAPAASTAWTTAPPEYRELVRRYFEAIAQFGITPPTNPPAQ